MSNNKPRQSRCTGNQSFSHHVFLVVTSSSSLGFPNDFTAWKAALQLRSFHGHFTWCRGVTTRPTGAPSLEVGFEAASPRDSFVHTWVHEAQYLLIFFGKTMVNSLGDHTILLSATIPNHKFSPLQVATLTSKYSAWTKTNFLSYPETNPSLSADKALQVKTEVSTASGNTYRPNSSNGTGCWCNSAFCLGIGCTSCAI